MPSARVLALPDHVVPLRLAVKLWATVPPVPVPLYILTWTLLLSPVALLAAPETVGFGSLMLVPSAGVVTVTPVGAVVSTTNVLVLEPPLLPAASPCVAWAV